MSTARHPSAPEHLPFFLPSPDGTDPLMVGTAIFLLVFVVALGVLYLRLHALPEHVAHRNKRIQFEVVCVLALLAMFTGEHLFWIIGLLLALIDFPDFSSPMRRIAGSVEKVAGLAPGGGDLDDPPRHAHRVPVEPVVATASRRALPEGPP